MATIYEIRDSRKDAHKDQGYDYNKTLLTKTLSNYLFRNAKIAGFLSYLNNIMVFYVNNVKYIRIYFNYTVPKNYQKIN